MAKPSWKKLIGDGKGYDYVKIVERNKNLIKRISEFNENPQ